MIYQLGQWSRIEVPIAKNLILSFNKKQFMLERLKYIDYHLEHDKWICHF